jgi:hypothetical protein
MLLLLLLMASSLQLAFCGNCLSQFGCFELRSSAARFRATAQVLPMKEETTSTYLDLDDLDSDLEDLTPEDSLEGVYVAHVLYSEMNKQQALENSLYSQQLTDPSS